MQYVVRNFRNGKGLSLLRLHPTRLRERFDVLLRGSRLGLWNWRLNHDRRAVRSRNLSRLLTDGIAPILRNWTPLLLLFISRFLFQSRKLLPPLRRQLCNFGLDLL